MSGGGVDSSRRAFLSGAPLTAAGRQRYAELQRPLGPALPWLAGSLSPAVCAACDGPCAPVCPNHIVQRHDAGHRLRGVPYLSFNQSGCSFCGACIDACPHSAQKTGQPVLGSARLDQQACLAWNGVVCISCVPRCEENALQRDRRGRVRVRDERCTGCGACVAVCPAGALSVAAALRDVQPSRQKTGQRT